MVHLQGGMLRCSQLLAAQILPNKRVTIKSSFASHSNLIKVLDIVLLEGSETVGLVVVSDIRHAALKNVVIHCTNLLKVDVAHAFWQPLFLPLATLVSVTHTRMVAVAAALQLHFFGFFPSCSGASELMTSAVCLVTEEVV